jgi:hypothetical protein
MWVSYLNNLFFLSLFWAISSNHLLALKVPIFFSWGGEKIARVATFPDTAEFKVQATGDHIDPGYRYKQIKILFIPVWNYDGHWCGYVGNEEAYLDLDKAQLDSLAQTARVPIPDSPNLPFWDYLGGKFKFQPK